MRWIVRASAVVRLAAGLAGCGGSAHTAATAPATTLPPTTVARAPATTAAGGPGALQAEANAAAAGDIPDNQVFLVFHNARAGYSMKYPEGWAQYGGGKAVVFRDKNNIVRIDVGGGPAPTAATIKQERRNEIAFGALEFHDVFKIFRSGGAETVALRGLDLRVESRELVALLGPSGSGKSTALHLAAALDEPSAGDVRVFGDSLSRLGE